jgi:hypothetical protein
VPPHRILPGRTGQPDPIGSVVSHTGIVWTSPSLATGPHTVTVRVTGDRSVSSTGYNVAIDSADVTTY